MNSRAGVWLQSLVVLGVAALLAAPPALFGADKGSDADANKASMDGKYSDLLRKIEVPDDKGAYGDFNDYGRYEGTEWAGYKDLPPGYWVYVAPNWYIWGGLGTGKDAALRKASVHGKYSRLLKKINVPDDEKSYGDFDDYGRFEGTEWAGYKDLPPGYWVYVAPNWYIWGEQGAPKDAALRKASVGGKYVKLLKKISVPDDKGAYGDFNEYGRYEGTEWAGYKDLPPGYWVYVAPNWYIWGEKKDK